MKKALIVGGSNGIGLSIAGMLVEQDYHVLIADMVAPDASVLSDPETYTYFPCNLLCFDAGLFEQISKDPEVSFLMITAGFGKVTEFINIHPAEIRNMMQVNTVAVLQILRIFYDRLCGKAPFFCGMMGSIAGLVSSPLFSVYAASKAALCRFAESVNIELEAAETENRILNVSPGSIGGTKFNGGSNDPLQTRALAEQIIERMYRHEELYIPDYENIYRGVIDRYRQDPHQYGMDSYRYKMQSGRVQKESAVRIGYLSGTFDLFHVGHLNLLKRAKAQCDYLIVGVHPDASHKGKQTFIPFEERLAVVEGCRYVDKAVPSCREDSDAWDLHHYHKLFVGSDYKGTERFQRYEAYFADKDVEIVYFPYTQGTSSTQIRNTIIQDKSK